MADRPTRSLIAALVWVVAAGAATAAPVTGAVVGPARAPAAESLPLGPVAAATPARQSDGVATDDGAAGGVSTDAAAVATGPMELLRTGGALGTVLALAGGLAVGVRWLAKKRGGLLAALGAGGRAPSGVMEVLGRYPVGRGQTLVVLRFDRRVLLVCQTFGKSAGMRTLCELADPDDVASIVTKTRDAAGETLDGRFRELMRETERAFDRPAKQGDAFAPAGPFGAAESERAGGLGSVLRRRVITSAEGDRVELLDGAPAATGAAPVDAVATLRARLDALRGGAGVVA